MFGGNLCSKMIDPFGRVREAWPRMSELIAAIDEGEIDSEPEWNSGEDY